MTRGHCTNLPSRCNKAKAREWINVTGPRTVCPECSANVKAVTEKSKGKLGLISGIIAGMFAALLLAWFFWGDGGEQRENNKGSPSQVLARLSCGRDPTLYLNGSNVLGDALAPALVEAWLKANGVTNLRRTDRDGLTNIAGLLDGRDCLVVIAGSNTADGLAALQRGQTDIAMSAQPLSPADLEMLSGLGDMTSPQAEQVAAIDALAVVVHPNNPIRQLTRGELADILAGRVSTWQSVRGAAGSIHLYVGAAGVRAADTTSELIGPVSDPAQRSASDAGVLEGVANDEFALGIVSYPAPTSVRTIAVGEQGATAFLPSPDTITTQSYPLTRRLYLYADPTPSNPNTTSFLRFVQGREGQAAVTRAGYGGQNIQVVNAPIVRVGASQGYNAFVTGARQLNIAFRFRTGAAQLDNKSLEDLERLLDFIRVQRPGAEQPLILIGFADADGSSEANFLLSQQRAEATAAALAARGVRGLTVRWFGEEQPVGDNATIAGRERNRRVEVWVGE